MIFFQINESLKGILRLGYDDQFLLLALYRYCLFPHQYLLARSRYAYDFRSLLAHAVYCETPQVISHHLLPKFHPKVAHLIEGGTSSDQIMLPDWKLRFMCFLSFVYGSPRVLVQVYRSTWTDAFFPFFGWYLGSYHLLHFFLLLHLFAWGSARI